MNGLFHEVSGHQDGIEGTEKNGLTNPQEGRAERMPSSVLESLEGRAEKMDSSVLASLEGHTEKMNSSVLASLEGYTEERSPDTRCGRSEERNAEGCDQGSV